MMKNYFVFVLVSTLFLSVFAQKIIPSKLPYITHYETVYIDGGCSFFNEVSTPLKDGKYQLIISAYKVAFIQGASKQILFKLKSRVKTNKGYIDYYSGNAGSFVLTINSINKLENHVTIRTGTLKMTTKSIKGIMNVHGKVYEIDIYNGYTKKQLHLKN